MRFKRASLDGLLSTAALCALLASAAGSPAHAQSADAGVTPPQTPAEPVAGTAAAGPAATPAPRGDTLTPKSVGADASSAPGGNGEIVVTGSRVIADGTRAPTPVTVVSADQLVKAAPQTIGEALNQLPVFQGSTKPSTSNFSATGPNTGSFLNLRDLGVQRTLLLVDGRRVSPSAIIGTTDTNTLPQELISRVDVVTGGASAAYGSDAVAGVVNFILDTNYTGLKGTAQRGISSYGDDPSYKLNLTGGMKFGPDDRGHIVLSGEYYDSAGVPDSISRPWGARLFGAVPSPTNPAFLYLAQNVRLSKDTFGGLITASPATATAPANLLAGQMFGPGGTVLPYNAGTLSGNDRQVGGDGAYVTPAIAAAVRSWTAFSHATYQLTDAVKVFAEFGYASVRNVYPLIAAYNAPQFNGITIYSGNPYIPTSIQSVMTANNIPSFTMGRISLYDFPRQTGNALNNTLNASAGVDADLFGDFKLSGYYTHGENRQAIRSENALVYTNFYASADAVDQGLFTTGARNGNIVCRVTLTNPGLYPGCVPINLFGVGSPSSAATSYVTSNNDYYVARIRRDVVSANISGTVVHLPAGPLKVSVGGEYRRDSVNQTSDPASQGYKNITGLRGVPAGVAGAIGAYEVTNAQPLRGVVNVKEAFGELAAPILSHSAVGTLDLNGAVRYTDYSTSGGVETWKVGAVYEPIDGFRLRVTRSRDIRAPNLSDLHAGNVQSFATVRDTQNNSAISTVLQSAVGNPALTPEKANTFTIGGVFQPTFVRGFSLSVDYYNINIKGLLATLTSQQTVDQCAAGSALACGLITRGAATAAFPAGPLISIVNQQLNIGKAINRGIDIEASYRTGPFTARAIVNHSIEDLISIPGGTSLDYAGQVGVIAGGGQVISAPKWSGTFNVNYDAKVWSAFVQERFIGAGIYDVTRIQGVTIDNNHIPARFYTDVTLRARVPAIPRVEFSLTVNNLFDRAPPNTATLGGPAGGSPVNAVLYDVIGRYFTFTARFAL